MSQVTDATLRMVSEGDRCITVSYGAVRGSARRYPYWQSAEYVARPRKRDGCLIWRYVRHLGEARRSRRLAEQDAHGQAEAMGLQLIYSVRDCKACE